MKTSVKLSRRGFDLGEYEFSTQNDQLEGWRLGRPVQLPGLCLDALPQHKQNLQQTEQLVRALLDEQECEHLISQSPYRERLDAQFESIGVSVNQGDQQEVETLLFDAFENDEIVAEDLWLKVSWLSFYEEDASIRFRFSFGEDLVEDVAADKLRQIYAAELCNAIFPESAIISQHQTLYELLREALACKQIDFVERIVYFNAPHGGAYLHHDRERGHAGVVYAQLTGRTAWLALNKSTLMSEIAAFVKHSQANSWPATISARHQAELIDYVSAPDTLADELETFNNDTLINLINQTAEFVSQLVARGHARLLSPGDVILLPQQDELSCCWHSVFCVGDEVGEALSFAIRDE